MISLLLAATLIGPPAPPPQNEQVTAPQLATQLDHTAECVVKVGFVAAGDVGSTGWALARCPTCREANPLGVNAEARIALKLSTAMAVGATCYALERSGHHNAARAVRLGYTLPTLYLIVANVIHAIRRQ